ncbi:uncharacterized protein LOC106010996 [Aplysia californica]|uniref:Uncharacterized protein LOC106010996 n=1 Tax=Aplysia californica TaxID=6500 RepID=A0ABM1ADJ2_APLCA|nr:uncharacterized protein LOC106010996 [Aplysia californica]
MATFPRRTKKCILICCLFGAITMIDLVGANSNLDTKTQALEEFKVSSNDELMRKSNATRTLLNEEGRQSSQHTDGSEKQAGVRDNLFKQHTRPRYPARGPGQVWDDVMMGFQTSMLEKTSDVTAPGDQEQCQEDLSRVFLSAVSQAPWALQFLDSWGKPGAGLFKYKPAFYGDFDTCIGLEPPENFTTQYCTVSVSAKRLSFFMRYIVSDWEDCCDGLIVLSVFAGLMALGTIYDVMVVRGYFRELTGSDGLSSNNARLSEQISGSYTDSTIRYNAKGEYQPLLDSTQKSMEIVVDYKPR